PRVLGKYGPGQGPGSGHAEVETNAADPPLVDVLPRWPPGVEHAAQQLCRSKEHSDAWRTEAYEPAGPESLGMHRQGDSEKQSGHADCCKNPRRSHSGLLLVVVDGRGRRPAVLTKPERDAEADQQYGAEQNEDDGLLQPGERGDGNGHRKAE